MSEKIEITKDQREILDHTANRSIYGFYCGDSYDMQTLVELGLMVSVGKKSFVPDEYFKLTRKGKQILANEKHNRPCPYNPVIMCVQMPTDEEVDTSYCDDRCPNRSVR